MNSKVAISLFVIGLGMFGLWMDISYSGWVLAVGLFAFMCTD